MTIDDGPPPLLVPARSPTSLAFSTSVLNFNTPPSPQVAQIADEEDLYPAAQSSPLHWEDNLTGLPDSPLPQDSILLSSPPDFVVPRSRAPAMSFDARISRALEVLNELDIAPAELLYTVLADQGPKYERWRNGFYRTTSKWLERLLDVIWSHPTGLARMYDWMEPHAADLVCERVTEEMRAVKRDFYMKADAVTPKFLAAWNINEEMKSLDLSLWNRVLASATEPEVVLENSSRSREIVRSFHIS